MAKQGKSKRNEYSGWLNEVQNNPPRPYPWKPYKDSLISPSHKSKTQLRGDKWVGLISLAGGLIILVAFIYAAFKTFSPDEPGTMAILLIVGVATGLFFLRVGFENLKHLPTKVNPPKKKKKLP